MTALIFTDQTEYNTFETKMALRNNIPKPGRNAATNRIEDPDNITGKGWTTRFTDSIDERLGNRVMTSVSSEVVLDVGDATKEETSKTELDKFGTLKNIMEV